MEDESWSCTFRQKNVTVRDGCDGFSDSKSGVQKAVTPSPSVTQKRTSAAIAA